MPQANGVSGGNGPTRAVYLEVFDDLVNAKAKVDSAQGSYRNVIKRAEGLGLNVAMLKASMKLRNQDRDRRESDFSDLAKYLAWLEIPIGTQAEMFAETEAEPSAEEAEAVEKHKANQAAAEGVYAGRCNANIASVPYQPGTEEHSLWVNSWHEGQRQAVAEMGGPVRRGRPRAKPAPGEGEPAGNA